MNAIRVLERMVPQGQLLFDHHAHDLRGTRTGTGSLTVHTLGIRVEDFITWANHEATAHGLALEIIPPDPHGRIGTERFRRSLAWHIARRAGGLVALAIQYGHLRTSVSAGYADPRELHQMGEKSQVASSWRHLHGLRRYYELTA
ncbi:hypothetical protein ACQEV2_41120 [Streptomyces sp. CA-251387]|uniref:hypothetical protein n=1 Tax=Streptomyces sp. CA-251387 TaxID=3240064 RepID=UPI003D8E776D